MFDADVFGGQGLRQSAFAGERHHIGRDADGGVFGQVCREPFVIWRNLPAFLQLDAAAGKLFGGLFPIAAVHPYARFIGGQGKRADRAGKARQLAPRLPMLGQVFGQVGVGGRDDERVQALRLHGFAQCGQVIRYGIHERILQRKCKVSDGMATYRLRKRNHLIKSLAGCKMRSGV